MHHILNSDFVVTCRSAHTKTLIIWFYSIKKCSAEKEKKLMYICVSLCVWKAWVAGYKTFTYSVFRYTKVTFIHASMTLRGFTHPFHLKKIYHLRSLFIQVFLLVLQRVMTTLTLNMFSILPYINVMDVSGLISFHVGICKRMHLLMFFSLFIKCAHASWYAAVM